MNRQRDKPSSDLPPKHPQVLPKSPNNALKNAYIKHSTKHEHEKIEDYGPEGKLPANLNHG